MNIQFYTYVSQNGPRGHCTNYVKHSNMLEMSIRLNQPNGYYLCKRGEAGADIFLERIKYFREMLTFVRCPAVYIDADAVLLKPLNDIFEQDFDIGAGYRYDRSDGHAACCVTLFSGRDRAKEIAFVDKWLEAARECFKTEPWFYEQIPLNDLLGAPKKKRTKKEYLGVVPYEANIENHNGLKVLYLDAFQIACPHTSLLPEDVRIVTAHHSIRNSIVSPVPL